MSDTISFSQLFEIILHGTKDDSREAARAVRKLLYSRHSHSDGIRSIISSAPKIFAEIVDSFRQENFVTAISVMYFLHDREKEPDFLFPWLFQMLQNNNGNIRHAAVRMIEHELGSLTVHIRHPKNNFSKTSPQQADQILFGLKSNLQNLLDVSWKPSYKKYKYIDTLPSSTYKSVQLIIAYLDDCYAEVC